MTGNLAPDLAPALPIPPSNAVILLAVIGLLFVLIVARVPALGRALMRVFLFVFVVAVIVAFTLAVVRSAQRGGAGQPVVPGVGGGSVSGTGTLSVSDDNGELYVNGGYIGRGLAVVTLPAGNYTLYARSPSTGAICWQTGIRIDAGRTTTVRQSSYCR